MERKIVSVLNLVKTYDNLTALNGISFDVDKGEVFGLLGPNGAGKTTTLECIEGIRKASSGRIVLGDCDPIKDEAKLRCLLGVQLQSSSLPDNITVFEAMALICSIALDLWKWLRNNIIRYQPAKKGDFI
jgi:ABC-2 type transport system ATP-binding protein